MDPSTHMHVSEATSGLLLINGTQDNLIGDTPVCGHLLDREPFGRQPPPAFLVPLKIYTSIISETLAGELTFYELGG